MSIKDFQLWQRLISKGDTQTTPQPSNQGLHVGHTHGWERSFSRPQGEDPATIFFRRVGP